MSPRYKPNLDPMACFLSASLLYLSNLETGVKQLVFLRTHLVQSSLFALGKHFVLATRQCPHAMGVMLCDRDCFGTLQPEELVFADAEEEKSNGLFRLFE